MLALLIVSKQHLRNALALVLLMNIRNNCVFIKIVEIFINEINSL